METPVEDEPCLTCGKERNEGKYCKKCGNRYGTETIGRNGFRGPRRFRGKCARCLKPLIGKFCVQCGTEGPPSVDQKKGLFKSEAGEPIPIPKQVGSPIPKKMPANPIKPVLVPSPDLNKSAPSLTTHISAWKAKESETPVVVPPSPTIPSSARVNQFNLKKSIDIPVPTSSSPDRPKIVSSPTSPKSNSILSTSPKATSPIARPHQESDSDMERDRTEAQRIMRLRQERKEEAKHQDQDQLELNLKIQDEKKKKEEENDNNKKIEDPKKNRNAIDSFDADSEIEQKPNAS
eukprot:TRINITY_DN1463_c0_g2_i1.p1 TRINITY_DN1463_c0_g2~~TRINITY_DN1463_c0_g2_i1.p1  ORF type:complete len:291 (-),score=89.35 TRINITY_DN1463_c0_g2_i1:171-1043(-)